MKIKLILTAVIAICITLCYLMGNYAKKQKQEKERHIRNEYALTEELSQRKVQDSINVATKRVLELKASEFEKLFKKEAEKVKMLDRKINDLQNMIVSDIVIHDTIRNVIVQQIGDSIQKFNYSDTFFKSLHGEIKNNLLTLDYQAEIEINFLQFVVPKRFLGFLWKTKKYKCIQVEAYSPNPNVDIVGVTAIKIEN